MLDAFIIEQIRRDRMEREKRDGARAPLRIEVPLPQPAEREEDSSDRQQPDRGSVVIDFQL